MPIQISQSTVVHKQPSNTQRVEQEVPIITVDSTPASPIPSTSTAPLRIPTPPPHCPTTVLVPAQPKPHVYATIAMLEHDPSPLSSPSPSPEPTTNPATAPPPPSPSTPLTSAPDQGASTDISSTAPVQVSTPPEEEDPLHIMPGTPQQPEIAPPAPHLTHKAHSSSSSPEPLPCRGCVKRYRNVAFYPLLERLLAVLKYTHSLLEIKSVKFYSESN